MPENVFPTLTDVQMERIAAHGRRRPIATGEVLVNVGDQDVHFFLLLSGAVQIFSVTPSGGEELIVTHHRGQFSGEANMITGRRALARLRVSEAGEVVDLDRSQLMSMIQTDADLSAILMRAFILRRLHLIEGHFGDVIVVGSTHDSGTLRVREFLERNGHPYQYLDLDRDADAQTILDQFHVAVDDVPVLVCRGRTVLRNPSNQKIAECLGFNDAIDREPVRDVIVVGAGPAGLAAAVYAASEGLDVLVLESSTPGGQAATSTKIENYLGFPNGISGEKLMARAYAQAAKFGAQVLVAKGARTLERAGPLFRVGIDGGETVTGRTVIIASGAQYRRLPLSNLSKFEGAGVYYAATPMEGQLCKDEDAIIVGGGNSAGQAAVFLADRAARHVDILVRKDGLAETMSKYLIRRIESHSKIGVKPRTEVVALDGGDHLECVRWRDNRTGAEETRRVRHLFMMTGAAPNTAWLDGSVVLNENGFVKTGPELSREQLAAAGWRLRREPFLLETSLPGVFAVGDVRCGNVKRCASAVGEGSIAVSFVHQVLRS